MAPHRDARAPAAIRFLDTNDSGRVAEPAAIRAVKETPALADLFGLNPPLLRPLDREGLAALGFGMAILQKNRPRDFGLRAHPAREPANLFDAPLDARIVTLSLFSGHKFQALRQQLERACGSPIAEDDKIAIFDLTSAGQVEAPPTPPATPRIRTGLPRGRAARPGRFRRRASLGPSQTSC